MRATQDYGNPGDLAAAPPRLSRRALLGGALGCAALGLAACRERGLDAAPADTPAPAAAYPRPEILADADWLAARLDDPLLRLLDCSPLPDYRRGHLPGARHVWWQDTIEVHNPVYGMLAGQSDRARLLDRAGVTDAALVVCYDGAGGQYAARLIWMLQAIGFANARLLNGGRQAWTTGGGRLARDEPPAGGGGITETPHEEVLAHGHDIVARFGEAGLIVLDTRTRAERAETWNGQLRRGTIPGSRWLPRDALLTPGPLPALLPPGDLRARLTDAGAPPDAPEIIVFGLHGTLAALPYVALQALGTPHARLYDGSWAEWGANPDWPIELIAPG